jgi:hypothetical protein
MPLRAAVRSLTSNFRDFLSDFQLEQRDAEVRVLEEIPHVVAVQEHVILLVRQSASGDLVLHAGGIPDEARYASSRDTAVHRPGSTPQVVV